MTKEIRQSAGRGILFSNRTLAGSYNSHGSSLTHCTGLFSPTALTVGTFSVFLGFFLQNSLRFQLTHANKRHKMQRSRK